MVATTWVQIIKACLLLGGGIVLMLLSFARFGFSFDALFREAVAAYKAGVGIMSPGSLMADPVSAVSLSLGLLFGTAGLPHIMMRFFTVPNAREARNSVFYATGFIGFFFLIVIILGIAAISVVGTNPNFFEGGHVGGKLIGGGNMAVMHLAKAVGLVILSPAVWVKVLGNAKAVFPYDHPAIISMNAAFFVTLLMSVTDKSARAAGEAEAFEEQYIRAQTGLGATAPSSH
ncbi:hypothetical protein AYM40_24965 [Paraburkholderia phytofirmans OLGA172]|uniref:Cation acetate symporter n=1 Tax=Paraburkholderia phytofirmans OLGA172 TaxID=1417228 RepID=A0A160FRH3_9BURK|nr:hypothetical protein AYM40_24965 [Paraburkholderia phytofirmans OLGA172]